MIFHLGTSHVGGYSHEAVVYALQKCGIRHIDTAKRYGCESLLQKAIKESGVKREDLWITTKLWHSDYGYENTKQACLESCRRLGVEYLGKMFLILLLYYSFHMREKLQRSNSVLVTCLHNGAQPFGPMGWMSMQRLVCGPDPLQGQCIGLFHGCNCTCWPDYALDWAVCWSDPPHWIQPLAGWTLRTGEWQLILPPLPCHQISGPVRSPAGQMTWLHGHLWLNTTVFANLLSHLIFV